MFLSSILVPVFLIPAGIILAGVSIINYGKLVAKGEYERATFVLTWGAISVFSLGVAIAHELEKLENLLNFVGAVLSFFLSY